MSNKLFGLSLKQTMMESSRTRLGLSVKLFVSGVFLV